MTAKESLLPVLVGALVGTALAFANALIGLKTGLWDTGQLTSGLVGFVLLAPLSKLFGHSLTPQGHVVMLTASASIAAMPATMGLLAAVPALAALGHDPSTPALLAGALSFGALGVATGVLLAPQLLDIDALPFPTGVAAAQLIESLHSSTEAVRQRTVPFVVAFVLAAAITLLRDVAAVVPGAFELTIAISTTSISAGLAASPMLFGGGALIGLRLGLSLALGTVVAWRVIASGVGSRGLVGPLPSFESLGAWLRWVGVALLVGASLPALVTVMTQVSSGAAMLGRTGKRGLLGLGAIALSTVAVTHFAFEVSWVFSVIAMLMALVLSTVASRAAGATDVAPLGDVGQLSQFVGALGGSAAVSVSVANVTAGSGAQATSTLWALKTGRLLKTPLSHQIWAQAAGVLIGAPVSVLVWRALTRAYTIGSAQLPAPTAAQWRSVADVLQGGVSALPPGALGAAAVAAAVGLALALGEKHPRFGQWLPAPVGLGLAFLITPTTALTLAAGAVLGALLMRRARGEALLLSVGSGLLAGEAIPVVGVVLWQLLRSP